MTNPTDTVNNDRKIELFYPEGVNPCAGLPLEYWSSDLDGFARILCNDIYAGWAGELVIKILHQGKTIESRVNPQMWFSFIEVDGG